MTNLQFFHDLHSTLRFMNTLHIILIKFAETAAACARGNRYYIFLQLSMSQSSAPQSCKICCCRLASGEELLEAQSVSACPFRTSTIISYNRAFFLRDLFCSREVLLPVFATTLLTPDIVKTAHIPIQHNCTLLEGGARFFATDPVRLQAEIANVDLCGSLSTGVETSEGNWIEIMQYTGISIQLQAKN